jgi:hypothetical protein
MLITNMFSSIGSTISVKTWVVRCSVHEVHVDEEQLRWFETALEAAGDRPVLVFTHAPPLGCGLKVLQEVHVKNRFVISTTLRS